MKAILMAAAAVIVLSGSAMAETTVIKDHHKKVVVIKKHHHRAHVTTDGYARGVPARDPGRYSNLPGKDGQYSKAYIQDH